MMAGKKMKGGQDVTEEDSIRLLFSDEIRSLGNDGFEGSSEEHRIFMDVFYQNSKSGATKNTFVTGRITSEHEEYGTATMPCYSNVKSSAVTLVAHSSHRYPSEGHAYILSEDVVSFKEAKELTGGSSILRCDPRSCTSFCVGGCFSRSCMYRKMSSDGTPTKETREHDQCLAAGADDVFQLEPLDIDASAISTADENTVKHRITCYLVEGSKQSILSRQVMLNPREEIGVPSDIDNEPSLVAKNNCSLQGDIENVAKYNEVRLPVAGRIDVHKFEPSKDSKNCSSGGDIEVHNCEQMRELVPREAFNLEIHLAPNKNAIEEIQRPNGAFEGRTSEPEILDLDMVNPGLTTAFSRDLRARFRKHMNQVFVSAGWTIEMRQRRSRSYVEPLYISPVGKGIEALHKAWRLCGQSLFVREFYSPRENNEKVWMNINEFWTDMSDVLDYMEKELHRNETAITLVRCWSLLDPFVTILYVDRKLGLLKAGRAVKVTNGISTYFEPRLDMTSTFGNVGASEYQLVQTLDRSSVLTFSADSFCMVPLMPEEVENVGKEVDNVHVHQNGGGTTSSSCTQTSAERSQSLLSFGRSKARKLSNGGQLRTRSIRSLARRLGDGLHEELALNCKIPSPIVSHKLKKRGKNICQETLTLGNASTSEPTNGVDSSLSYQISDFVFSPGTHVGEPAHFTEQGNVTCLVTVDSCGTTIQNVVEGKAYESAVPFIENKQSDKPGTEQKESSKTDVNAVLAFQEESNLSAADMNFKNLQQFVNGKILHASASNAYDLETSDAHGKVSSEMDCMRYPGLVYEFEGGNYPMLMGNHLDKWWSNSRDMPLLAHQKGNLHNRLDGGTCMARVLTQDKTLDPAQINRLFPSVIDYPGQGMSDNSLCDSIHSDKQILSQVGPNSNSLQRSTRLQEEPGIIASAPVQCLNGMQFHVVQHSYSEKPLNAGSDSVKVIKPIMSKTETVTEGMLHFGGMVEEPNFVPFGSGIYPNETTTSACQGGPRRKNLCLAVDDKRHPKYSLQRIQAETKIKPNDPHVDGYSQEDSDVAAEFSKYPLDNQFPPVQVSLQRKARKKPKKNSETKAPEMHIEHKTCGIPVLYEVEKQCLSSNSIDEEHDISLLITNRCHMSSGSGHQKENHDISPVLSSSEPAHVRVSKLRTFQGEKIDLGLLTTDIEKLDGTKSENRTEEGTGPPADDSPVLPPTCGKTIQTKNSEALNPDELDNSKYDQQRSYKRLGRYDFDDDDLLIAAVVRKKKFGSITKDAPFKRRKTLSKSAWKQKNMKGSCRLMPKTLPKCGELGTDGKLCSDSRTVISWLIDNGSVSVNDIMEFRNSKDGSVVKDGWVTREGILCRCCNNILCISEFKVHAGFKSHRPCLNLFLESGKQFTLCQLHAWSVEYKARKSVTKSAVDNEADQNDDTCGLCGDGGELICCDNCPSTFHQACLLAQDLPEDKWYCPNCTCRICGSAVNEKEPSNSLSVLKCSQCENKYHEICISREFMKKKSGPDRWFCGHNCHKVYSGLHSRIGAMNHLSDGFYWTLLKCIISDQKLLSAQKFAQMADMNTKLAVALTIMEECFQPMVDPRTGIDMIPQVLYNWGSDFARLNYRGFYTIILEKADKLISVASIRVHGVTVAEMPLIATCSANRRQGMCRRLLNAVEEMLRSFNVELLVISAIPSLVDTWMSGFGFKPMEIEEKQQLHNINLMIFPGTVLLKKNLNEIKSSATKHENEWVEASNIGTILDPGPTFAGVEPVSQGEECATGSQIVAEFAKESGAREGDNGLDLVYVLQKEDICKQSSFLDKEAELLDQKHTNMLCEKSASMSRVCEQESASNVELCVHPNVTLSSEEVFDTETDESCNTSSCSRRFCSVANLEHCADSNVVSSTHEEVYKEENHRKCDQNTRLVLEAENGFCKSAMLAHKVEDSMSLSSDLSELNLEGLKSDKMSRVVSPSLLKELSNCQRENSLVDCDKLFQSASVMVKDHF